MTPRKKISYHRFFYLFAFLLFISCSKDDSKTDNNPIPFSKTSKVVGYLPSYKFAFNSQIEYCKLTHLNLAFANPDADGNLIIENISTVVNTARAANSDIIISISLAGGHLTAEQETNWSNLIDITTNRPAYISKIVDYVNQNNLDGVDVDLEWTHVTTGYSDFVIELKAALTPHQKIITAALPNNTRYPNASDEALAAFDFINIMAYDETGPWSPNNVTQHSSYQFAEAGINFWNNTVNIPKTKLTLGVPFYGYDFDQNPVSTATYGSLVSYNPTLANSDSSGSTYYNGIPTIEAKVNLGLNNAGGIMIWELGQDSFDQYSLLSTIHNRFTFLEVKTTGLCGNVPQ